MSLADMAFHDDIALFDAMRRGDKPSFDALFMKYYFPLCAYSEQFVDRDEGEDIVQTFMLNMWEKRCQLAPVSSLGAYFFASVRNKCLTAATAAGRQNRILRLIHEKVRAETENPDYYDVDKLTREIAAALAKLPDTYRATFVMNRMEEKSYRQIADQLDVSVQTVAWRIGQSLKILRRELKDYMPLLMLL